MSVSPIRFYDRYRNTYCEEAVYGEWALRSLYGNGFGRLIGLPVLSRPLFSRFFGWYMSRPGSRAKIRPFIDKYNLDPSEFLDRVDRFTSFNAFFCRKLKPESRPINDEPRSIVFPADGRHLGWQETGSEQQVFVKGQRWDLPRLLNGDSELVEKFDRCTLVLSRLCPVDYHHFHFPESGTEISKQWHGHRLFSVSPIALRQTLSYIWRNKRCVTRIHSQGVGEYCMIEIGATNVGSIRHNAFPPETEIAKGTAKGWFEFGGSSIITLFQHGTIELQEDLVRLTREGTELYARMGDKMALKV